MEEERSVHKTLKNLAFWKFLHQSEQRPLSYHPPEPNHMILVRYVAFLGEMSQQELPQILLGEVSKWETQHRVSMAEISAVCAQEINKYLFRVPRLKKLPEGQNGIKKYRPVKEFISFLVRLLCHKTGSITDSCEDQINSLNKDLRFFLTVLGDTSLMVCADLELKVLENLLAEFEAVANEAGSFVYSLFFVTGQAVGEKDDEFSVVLDHMNLLKANIMNLSDVVPACTDTSVYMPPDTSVVDSFLVLDSLVNDLDDLKNRDDNPIDDGVKGQIQYIHRELICLHGFIQDIFLPQPSEIGQLKEYYMRIGGLAHQARHLIISFLAGAAPSWYLLNRLVDVNQKVERCRFELPEMMMEYKSRASKFSKYFNKQVSSELSNRNTEVDDNIVGFEEKMIHMLDHLVGGGAELRVISIFGMPGLGKTTLAKKLYNHPSVSERFDRLSWCVVSQTYLKHSVLANVLIHIASGQLGKDVILKMEEDRLAEHIHKTLKGRRYLIVMDDIWDSNVCDELVRCFPDDGNGSRILFTTRNKDVAPPNSIMYALPSLSDDQCWELLQKKVFDNQPCPPNLVKTGKELAARCGGMPLAAIVLAGILSNKDKDARSWEEVRRNLSLHILDCEDNFVMQILKLSYDHLTQDLKLCFLYLGVFLEDKIIPARHMMNMWIAEGFVNKENKKDAAEGYLNELIDKSLVMVAKRRSDGGPKTCLVHDLIRELCLKTCEEEKLTRFVNNKYIKNIQDFRWRSSAWICRRETSNQIELPDIRLLRVLYLDSSFIYLIGIEYLVCLKYLVVCDLPPSIANLVNLEYLCVEAHDKVYLPSTIMQMKKLKYVDVSSTAGYGKDCSPSLRNKVEFLSIVLIRNKKDKKMLKCSPHLRRLKCIYLKRERKLLDLSFLAQLESLTIRFTEILRAEVIMSLPSSIKKLALSSFESGLSRETMSMLGKLKHLEVLKLKYVKFEGKRWDTRDGEFEELRYLSLDRTDLRQWNVGSSEHFPRLQHLKLHRCMELGDIPAEIGEIPMLKTIEVEIQRWESKTDNEIFSSGYRASARRMEEEQREMGNEDLRVVTSFAHDSSDFYYLPWRKFEERLSLSRLQCTIRSIKNIFS